MRSSSEPGRLIMEIFHDGAKQWIQVGVLNPGDPPGSISDNHDDGTRDVYVFECAADGSGATIYKSKKGIDIANEAVREIYTENLEVEKSRLELTRGQSHEMEVKTDRSPQKRKVRFRFV